ncbi:MAG TPA: J domain-containing protein [Coleofasciculaceae cyanobacterium]
MPSTANKSKPTAKKTQAANQPTLTTQLNETLQSEILRIAEIHGVSPTILENFACFVIDNHKKKPAKAKTPKIKPLTLTQLKESIFKHFEVKNTTELKKSGSFKMATDGMDALNLSAKDGWEKLYRKFIGVLPGEENQQGYGCINGINVFNYFKPWQVFGLDSQAATPESIKRAYHDLSKVYHPDVPDTGDAQIFDRINIMYRSISAEA